MHGYKVLSLEDTAAAAPYQVGLPAFWQLYALWCQLYACTVVASTYKLVSNLQVSYDFSTANKQVHLKEVLL